MDENLQNKYKKLLERLRSELMESLVDVKSQQQQDETDINININISLVLDLLENNNNNKSNIIIDDDIKLLKYVMLLDATPNGLAKFAKQSYENQKLIEGYLFMGSSDDGDDDDNDTSTSTKLQLLKQMLLADGPNGNNFGRAISIYNQIIKEVVSVRRSHPEYLTQQQPDNNNNNIFQRLAIAISLEHATPINQSNTKDFDSDSGGIDNSSVVDPIQRYLHYQHAYLNGELDPMFDTLSVFELRHVVNGDEPDSILSWGRKMLRNYRPDHILEKKGWDWRYVGIVKSNIRYGSQDVKYDLPSLQKYQNILMNGGVCGRRAFFGRFILRSFGIPTTARPSKGHGALCHYSPNNNKGWVVNLGGGWGCGWTKTQYHKDIDFLATTQARRYDPETYNNKVKKSQWIGDVVGEKRYYGEHDKNIEHIGLWYGMSLQIQRAIINENKLVTPPNNDNNNNNNNNDQEKNKNNRKNASGNKHENTTTTTSKATQSSNNNNNNHVVLTIDEKVLASPVISEPIEYWDDGSISIPAAEHAKFQKKKDMGHHVVMRSFDGGKQLYLESFSPQGQTMMRGGTWKNDANTCCSGSRMLSGGYGKYHNWGFRVAVSIPSMIIDGGSGVDLQHPISSSWSLDLDNNGYGGTMPLELIYVKPGKFIMGGESTEDGRFQCVEVPKHPVEITRGYYLGKYPVTQAQYESVMGKNPSKSTKHPSCPVDDIGENDAYEFCTRASELTGEDVRLPTEAEWEYACRATSNPKVDTKWFFGDDPSILGEYAWFKDNADGRSHPVGQKKPNPFGFYDMYGNVCERISDKYAKNYYEISPTIDPTGPSQGTKSNFQIEKIRINKSGKYALSAQVVTVNPKQRLNVSVNCASKGKQISFPPGNVQGGKKEAMMIVMELPFTIGDWEESKPITLDLEAGEVTLNFWRDKPPQYGIAIKRFIVKPLHSLGSRRQYSF